LHVAAPIAMSASEYEGFGLVLTEAMASGSAGVAVAGSAVPGGGGGAGWLGGGAGATLLAGPAAHPGGRPGARGARGGAGRGAGGGLHLGRGGVPDARGLRRGARVKDRVVAVIVHWRDVADTVGCVESLAGEPGVEVLVVDNGSPEPVGPALAGHPVTCLASGENRGYAGGGNLGIRAALSRGATTVLLLNNDARVMPGATAAATRMLAGAPRIAAVGGKVLARSQPGRLWLAWGDVTWRPSLVALRGSGEPDGPPYGSPRQVDWIAGCAMWLRAEALASIGLLDEEFFLYHEEVEWCVRA